MAVEPVVRPSCRLREAAWIAHNREVVDMLSGGRIGYVYMSDMGQLGMQQFIRQFYNQIDKQALIMGRSAGMAAASIDTGGAGAAAPRAGRRWTPTGERAPSHHSARLMELLNGPKVALLNHWSGVRTATSSRGLFKRLRAGPVDRHHRAWGGVRGIRGDWQLLDGGYITIPEDAEFTPESQWAVENHGVDPDIELENQPADLLAGHDAQLEMGVSVLMKQIASNT